MLDYINPGVSATASRMNALYGAFDSKMVSLLSGKSFFMVSPNSRAASGAPEVWSRKLIGLPFFFCDPARAVRSWVVPDFDGTSYAEGRQAAFSLSLGLNERVSQYGVAEIVIENYPGGILTMLPTWNRFCHYRVHNMGETTVRVRFPGLAEITLKRWEVCCVQGVGSLAGGVRSVGGFVLGFKYFFRFQSGDPRCYWFPGGTEAQRGNRLLGSCALRSGHANNRLNNSVLLEWALMFEGRRRLTRRGWTRWEGGRWESDPQSKLLDLSAWDADYRRLYGEITADRKAGDLFYHRGLLDIYRLPSAASGHAASGLAREFSFEGLESILTPGFAGLGFTVFYDTSGDLVVRNAKAGTVVGDPSVEPVYITAKTTNAIQPPILNLKLLTQNLGPFRPATYQDWKLSMLVRPVTGGGPPLFAPVERRPVTGVQYGFSDGGILNVSYDGELFLNVAEGRSSPTTSLSANTVRVKNETVADLLTFNLLWIGNGNPYPLRTGTFQNGNYSVIENRKLVLTGCGLVMFGDVAITASAPLAKTWLPKGSLFPGVFGHRQGDDHGWRASWYEQMPRVTFSGRTVKAHAHMTLNGRGFPVLERSDWSYSWSPRDARYYGEDTLSGQPSVNMTPGEIYDFSLKTSKAAKNDKIKFLVNQRIDGDANGFPSPVEPDGLLDCLNHVNGDLSKATQLDGMTGGSHWLRTALNAESWNVLAWRVNSLTAGDPLQVSDVEYPFLSGNLMRGITLAQFQGVDLEWLGVSANAIGIYGSAFCPKKAFTSYVLPVDTAKDKQILELLGMRLSAESEIENFAQWKAQRALTGMARLGLKTVADETQYPQEDVVVYVTFGMPPVRKVLREAYKATSYWTGLSGVNSVTVSDGLTMPEDGSGAWKTTRVGYLPTWQGFSDPHFDTPSIFLGWDNPTTGVDGQVYRFTMYPGRGGNPGQTYSEEVSQIVVTPPDETGFATYYESSGWAALFRSPLASNLKEGNYQFLSTDELLRWSAENGLAFCYQPSGRFFSIGLRRAVGVDSLVWNGGVRPDGEKLVVAGKYGTEAIGVRIAGGSLEMEPVSPGDAEWVVKSFGGAWPELLICPKLDTAAVRPYVFWDQGPIPIATWQVVWDQPERWTGEDCGGVWSCANYLCEPYLIAASMTDSRRARDEAVGFGGSGARQVRADTTSQGVMVFEDGRRTL